MAGAQVVEVLLVGNADRLKAAFAESSSAATTSSGTIQERMAGIGAKATAAFGIAAVAIGVFSFKMAEDFEVAHARLTTAIRNAGDSWKTEQSAVEGLDSRMQKLGFTQSDVEGNLSTLVNVTKDSGKAIADMGLAADIARGRHIDLSTAVNILAKVETGHVALLGRLGINTKDATGATISQEEAIKRLTALYGGQASAYSETFSGKIKTLEATLTNLGVKIGQVLIPIIESLATALSDTISWFEKNQAAAYALGVVIGGFLVTAIGIFIATKVAAAAAAIGEAFAALSAAAETLALKVMYAADAGFAGLAASAIGVLGPLALVAGAAYGLYTAFHESGVEVDLNAKKLQSLTALTVADSIVKARDLGKQWGDNTVVQRAWTQALNDSVPSALKFIEAANMAGIKTDAWSRQLYDHIGKTRDMAASKQAANELIDQNTQQIDKNTVALQKNIDSLSKQADAGIAAQRSGLAQTDALKALNDQQAIAFIVGGQDAAANEDLTKKTLDAEQAILDHAKATEGATGKTGDYIGTLLQTAGTLAPGSPLRVWLDAYIAKLQTTPGNVTTTVNVNGADDAIYKIGALQEALGYLTSHDWEVAVNIMGNASGPHTG